ncbi:hypothetical protein OC845_000520 [Tilletia horrida]|nr:hypothetical protein OC845_000520 [Tilletia horrida]
MNSTNTPKGQAPGGVKATPKQTVKATSKPQTKSPATTKLDGNNILLGQDVNAPRPTGTPSTNAQTAGKKTVLPPKTIPKDLQPASVLVKRDVQQSPRHEPDKVKKLAVEVKISESPCVCTFQRACPSHNNYHSLAALELRKDGVRKLKNLDIWPANKDHPLWTEYNPPPKRDGTKGAKGKPKVKADSTQVNAEEETATQVEAAGKPAPFKAEAVDHIIEIHEVERAYYRAQKAWEATYYPVGIDDKNEIEKKLIEIFNERDNLCIVPTNFNGWKFQFLRFAGDDDIIKELKLSPGGVNAHLRPNDRVFIRLNRTILSLWMDTVKLSEDGPNISRSGIISTSLRAYYKDRLDARQRTLKKLSEAAAKSNYGKIFLWVGEALEEDKKRFDETQAQIEKDFLMLSQALDDELTEADEKALENTIAERAALGRDDDYESEWEEDV